MRTKLFIQAITKYLLGLLLVSVLLFLPAGSFGYWNAWLFIGLLFIPMFIAGIILLFLNPWLLKKRLNAREQESEQRTVIVLSGIIFLAAFVAAGLNYRFSWITLPLPAVIVSAVLFLAAYVMYAEVLRENEYLSRTIEVQENQKVVDTGLYGIVRHPMYSSTVILFLSMGLLLGSPISFVILLCYVPVIAKRIRNEESVLSDNLDGYTDYMQKVKYRLIPFIW